VRFIVDYPIQSEADDGAWVDAANIAGYAQAAETAGLDAIALSDHPAPSLKWLQGGGHETFDPFVALGFWAGVTRRLTLMTSLVVLPYRNPFLTARSMMSVDVLSGGRTLYALGAGYLRSEFAALNVPFDERNARFDESVEVIRRVLTTDDVHYDGRYFQALGQTVRPRVVQQPHPPLWVGGNSRTALERVARWGQGWMPMVGGGEAMARTSRTPAIADLADLAPRLDELEGLLAEHGRSRADIDLCTGAVDALRSVDQAVDEVGRLRELGVTWTRVHVPHERYGEAVDAMARFGADVLPQLR
jgi:probable F420-dependent oxidoreductase